MPYPSAAVILRALADLAPAAPERVFDVVRRGQPLVWLDDPNHCPRNRDIDRLAALDLLHRDERILRRAWGMVVGTIHGDTEAVDGAGNGTTARGGAADGGAAHGPRRVRLPLVVEPVRLERTMRGYRVIGVGDLEFTPFIEGALAAQLDIPTWLRSADSLDDPRIEAWMRVIARAAGLPVRQTKRIRRAPGRPSEELVLYVGAALFTVRDDRGRAIGDRLRGWAARPGLEETALAAVYGATDDTRDDPAQRGGTRPDHGAEPVRSPMPLTRAQMEVVRRARSEPVTVVSGPPGNGKSHAIVAAAIDVVDRGGSVLVVTQSVHAADVLGDLFDRYPGPVPVLFGDAERRAAIAAMLDSARAPGQDPNEVVPATAASLAADSAAVRAAVAEVERLTARLVSALELEHRATTAKRWEPALAGLRADAPGVFEPDADLERIHRLLTDLPGEDAGRWRRWRHSLAVRRARRRLRVGRELSDDRLVEAVEAARAVAAKARLAAIGGTDLAARWPELADAHDRLAVALGRAMARRARSGQRWDRAARRAAAGLAVALRAGRNRRRELLAALDAHALVRALPLWVGTVGDVEDLLPATPGLFDLVVLDEASHIDQIRAAPALARARRAMVVGDPRQLRFVSFIADVDVAATLDRYGLDGRLDVRRVSCFDLAAGAADMVWLDEHFRCVPHLIEFSARRFYGDRIAVATRHPRNEATDAIDVVTVSAARTENGVNRAEVAAAIAVVRDLAERGERDIGLVTPFREQADAIDAALLAEFPVTEIERLGLRVGTVHSFQGSEADTVVVCLTVADGDPAGRLRFLTDANLFNVMVTRARRRIVVLNSLTAPDGLVAEYLRHAETPPSGLACMTAGVEPSTSGPVPRDSTSPAQSVPAVRSVQRSGRPAADTGGWTDRLAAELVRLGIPVRRDYPVGRWRLDLCVGPAPDASGLICGVHPDGPTEHIARHLALARAGWSLVEAFASRWDADPVRAALDLATQLRPASEARAG